MSPEIKLTKEIVDEVSGELRKKFESSRVVPLPGELYDGVFQTLAQRLGLPFRDIGVAVIADWEDPRVKEFARQLREFKILDAQVDPIIKTFRVPYRGIPEDKYPTIRYATSLPDKGTLLDITEFTQREYKPSYLFVALVEQGEKRDVIFAPGPSHDKIQEALEGNGMMGARFNHAQLGLSEFGEICNVMLRNYWGETRGDRKRNVVTLLGKINPELFFRKSVLIGVSGGELDFIFNPTTGEMEDSKTKALEKVPQLY